ncbi:MAG: type II toxin-antitoxin system HicA family toxin [Eubacterium sp.]|nr:type II toxin-antitoxin system HicA family toxin [Eubacterium sp.]
MSQKEKLIKKLLSGAKDFTFNELSALLSFYGYTLTNKGRTSGSRVMFTHKERASIISMHKPHGRKELLNYQMKQVIDVLTREGFL